MQSREELFSMGGFTPGMEIENLGLGPRDYTICMQISNNRSEDRFYVVPTKVIRIAIKEYRTWYLNSQMRNGGSRKDLGWWTLRLNEPGRGGFRPDCGFEKKWQMYLEAWPVLEQDIQ
jgi:hypothetical protein